MRLLVDSRRGQKIRRYLRLMWIFLKSDLLNELEYRASFWSSLALSTFWLVWASLITRVFFIHTPTVLGWSYYELLVVVGVFFVLNGVRTALLAPNLSHLAENVRTGALDYILTKPVSAQFLLSVRHVSVFHFADPLLGVALIGYASVGLRRTPRAADVALLMLMLLDSTIILYSMTLVVQSLTVRFVGTENADRLVGGVLEMGRYPIDFYKGWLRALLTGPIPVAILTTLPARAMLGSLTLAWALASLGVAALLLGTSSWLLNHTIRHYTSASS